MLFTKDVVTLEPRGTDNLKTFYCLKSYELINGTKLL